mgnify:CR=1 FL=1
MALFDNVTYTYYANTLHRAEVPDAATFDKYALEEKLYVKQLIDDGLIVERAPGNYDDACCMLIEESYKADKLAAGGGNVDTSETIGSYSHSMSAKAAEIATEKNQKSAAENKYKWLKLYCYITNARR